MFKQTALIIGLGLSISLTACSPSSSSAPDTASTPDTGSTPEASKPEAPRTGENREARREGGGEGRREGRTPPEAAYAACASAAAQSSCSFETPRGTRNGVCRTRKGEDRAICAVQRPERSDGQRPEGRRPRPDQ